MTGTLSYGMMLSHKTARGPWRHLGWTLEGLPAINSCESQGVVTSLPFQCWACSSLAAVLAGDMDVRSVTAVILPQGKGGWGSAAQSTGQKITITDSGDGIRVWDMPPPVT